MLSCGNYRNQILPLQGLFLLIVGCSCLFVQWLFHSIFTKTVFLGMCGYWSFFSIISAVSQWPDRDFLQCFVPKKERRMEKWTERKEKIILRVFADCLFVESLLHLAMLLTIVLLAFTSLFALHLKISKKLKFMVWGIFLSMRPALGMHVAF